MDGDIIADRVDLFDLFRIGRDYGDTGTIFRESERKSLTDVAGTAGDRDLDGPPFVARAAADA